MPFRLHSLIRIPRTANPWRPATFTIALLGSISALPASEPAQPREKSAATVPPSADPAAAGHSPPALQQPPAEFAGDEGVLALVDGRCVIGKVTSAPGGYLIKRPGASDEMIPHFLVWTAADSLTGCYENLRSTFRSPRPDDHLKLADWCIRQKLYPEARTEVVAALQLDPNRREARDLLVRLERALNPDSADQKSEPGSTRRSDGFLASAPETTEGVSPDTTSLFVRRVQQILVSKCGNAACHGGNAGGEFQLTNIRRTQSSGRTTNIENLREVLSFIDSGDVESTRLMKALSSPAHANVFTGTAGPLQETRLREWVQAAALDLGMRPSPRGLQPANAIWTPEKIALASGERPAAPSRGKQETAGSRPAPLQKASSPPVLRKTDPLADPEALAQAKFATEILKEERRDPFDPGEFNRRVEERRTTGR